MSPEEYVKEFDHLFLAEKHRILTDAGRMMGRRPDPYSDQYGMASAALNRRLREQCKEPADLSMDTPEDASNRLRLRWAYAYWWNRTHLLEEIARSRLGGSQTKKNMEKGGNTLRGLILGEISPDKLHPQFKRLIDALNAIKPAEAGFVRKSAELSKEGMG